MSLDEKNAQLMGRMIQELNRDLEREYLHMMFYLNASIRVEGIHREEYKDFFAGHASGEMDHIKAWSLLIQGLGADILAHEQARDVSKYLGSSDPADLLKAALELEEEVVANYVQRIEEAVELQKTDPVNGKYIELFLEDQIMDSRGDVDELKRLIG